MDFGEALKALKEGKRVCRTGWNGKNMYLYLTKGSHVKQARDNALDEMIQKKGEAVINPHIDLKTAQDTFTIGWVASQTDMMADDWTIVS